MFILEEFMCNWRREQMNKHGLGDTYVEDSINELTNYEFLLELSDALERMQEAFSNT